MNYKLPLRVSTALHLCYNFPEMASASRRTNCAKITLLSNCTPSPLARRGQGEVEMASAGWRTNYAKITLLSNCTPSPLTRRGQGEVEMAHKYAVHCAKVCNSPLTSLPSLQGQRTKPVQTEHPGGQTQWRQKITHQPPVSCVNM